MKPILLLIFFSLVWAGHASAESYRKTITIFVENQGSFPNRIQVRDVPARYGIPEDCRVAKRIAGLCGRDPGRELRPFERGESRMNCAAAWGLMEQPRCSIKDLIFDDWVDPGMKVKLEVHLANDGYGLVAVRAVNNTESWTFKPGLRDGETVGHQ